MPSIIELMGLTESVREKYLATAVISLEIWSQFKGKTELHWRVTSIGDSERHKSVEGKDLEKVISDLHYILSPERSRELLIKEAADLECRAAILRERAVKS